MHIIACSKWLDNGRKVNNCENTVFHYNLLWILTSVFKQITANLLIIGIN